MIIAVDFDDTICADVGFPTVGPPVPYALEYLRKVQEEEAKLILWTLRTGKALIAAVEFLTDKGIVLWDFNKNPDQKYWNQSPKVHADLYIDDKALGAPLTVFNHRLVMNWQSIGPSVVTLARTNRTAKG